LRDEAQIQAAVKELDAGAAFDEVARKDGRVPDMGFLDWRQVPPAWRSAVYALKPGERTGIIKGPNNRFWVLQLLETRPNASLTFEQVKTQLIAELQTQRSAPLAAQLSEQLRAKATVVFSPGNADSAR
jgi:parvulin-like peptidyl-prolyl isomerase